MSVRNIINTLIAVSILFLAGCAHQLPEGEQAVFTGNQLIVVAADSRNTTVARLYAFERKPASWELRTGPLPAVIGRKGFAPANEKREGDLRAPTGLFPLESAFGYAPSIDTRMPYRQATADDLWVDDVKSADYNKWVKRGETTATSFEVMKLDDNRYRHGVVTGYNRNPVIKGYGSAIFLHAWLKEDYPTTGCVAIKEEELVKLLSWLDPVAKPHILMGVRDDLPLVLGLPEF